MQGRFEKRVFDFFIAFFLVHLKPMYRLVKLINKAFIAELMKRKNSKYCDDGCSSGLPQSSNFGIKLVLDQVKLLLELC